MCKGNHFVDDLRSGLKYLYQKMNQKEHRIIYQLISLMSAFGMSCSVYKKVKDNLSNIFRNWQMSFLYGQWYTIFDLYICYLMSSLFGLEIEVGGGARGLNMVTLCLKQFQFCFCVVLGILIIRSFICFLYHCSISYPCCNFLPI